MFGYVRARQDTLTPEGLAGYESAYCGLCHTLGRRRGPVARLFLNYDFVFLAMLLAPPDFGGAEGCRRCLLHPVRGKPACSGGDWLDVVADESVILTYWKLRDSMHDDGFTHRNAARIMTFFLRRAYRGAQNAQPAFDSRVAECLGELNVLEAERCPSIDRTADCFARLLAAAAPATGWISQDRAIEQLLYHLGRWIYLIDGVDDLEEDRRAGRYNPVAARFPDWTQEDQAYLRRTMDHSLRLAGSAFQLLPSSAWTPEVENILYSGLPGVQELVFSGQWRDRKKRHRRNRP